MNDLKTIKLNDIEYVKKDDLKQFNPAKKLKGLEYSIVRTYSAGVFAGYVAKEEGQEVELYNARRLWYWDGAASLSQLAMEGVKKPENCKFPCEVDSIRLKQVTEITPCTEEAQISINNVNIWKQ